MEARRSVNQEGGGLELQELGQSRPQIDVST
jgi:hypothetical protein